MRAALADPRTRTGQRVRDVTLALALLAATGCGSGLYEEAYVSRANAWLGHFANHRPQRVLRGQVTYYHDSLAGNHTANGEIYDPRMLTAASRTLPFGTIVRVIRLDNGRTVTLRINDRGPFGRKRRLLDLSRAAAERIDILTRGVANVRAEVLWVPR